MTDHELRPADQQPRWAVTGPPHRAACQCGLSGDSGSQIHAGHAGEGTGATL